MTTTRIRNNTGGVTIHVAHNGDITIQGRYTSTTTATESVNEDGVAALGGAPTNSMSAQAIAGGRDGDQPPIKNKKSKDIIASMLRRKMRESK